jgi:DNA-binding transcriptional LysR family regulator
MSGLDLTDLRMLDELQKTGSISRTAEHVQLSQPSVSIRLKKLRQHFKDPLFVQTSEGMCATSKGDDAIAAARHALRAFGEVVTLENNFDPKTSHRTFRLCMTDVSQIVILPRLLTALISTAPTLSVDVINPQGEIDRMLEAGNADLAIGVRVGHRKRIIGQVLFNEHFACLASSNHPRVRSSISRQQFLRESHVAPQLVSASMGSWSLRKIPRHIPLRMPSLFGLAQIVANTELLAVVPLHLGQALAEEGRVRALPVPMGLPSYRVFQYWHQRYHTDAGHRWMRSTIKRLFSRESPTGP